MAFIREQWDKLVRGDASLGNQTAPTHTLLARLASSAPNHLTKALMVLEHVVKTLALYPTGTLRERMQLRINQGNRLRHSPPGTVPPSPA
jgi:TnpA family transposase